MLYKLKVVEELNGKRYPIVGASVAFVGMQGQTLVTMKTDANGYVFIDDSTDGDLLFSGVNVSITARGFYETRFPAENLEPDYWAQLEQKPNFLLYGVKVATITAVGLILISGKYDRN